MADKQTGTGARGKQNRSEEQGKTERGNHTKSFNGQQVETSQE